MMTRSRLNEEHGFTLAEVLVAAAAVTIIAGAAYTLLATVLGNHDTLASSHREVTHSAHITEMIRSEVATAASFDLVKDESLVFTTSAGQRVMYHGDAQPDGSIIVSRHTVDGGGSIQGTMFLARLVEAEAPPSLVFTQPTANRVQVNITSSDFATQFSAARWIEP